MMRPWESSLPLWYEGRTEAKPRKPLEVFLLLLDVIGSKSRGNAMSHGCCSLFKVFHAGYVLVLLTEVYTSQFIDAYGFPENLLKQTVIVDVTETRLTFPFRKQKISLVKL